MSLAGGRRHAGAGDELTRYGGIVEPEIDYAEPGPLTGLEGFAPEVLEGIGDDPVQVCMPVHLLVVQPDAARELGRMTAAYRGDTGEDYAGMQHRHPGPPCRIGAIGAGVLPEGLLHAEHAVLKGCRT